MLTLSRKRLYGREAMLRALLRAGQFAHLSEHALSQSLAGLWDIDKRLAWIDEDGRSHAYNRSMWAERAVSIALVKAAETGLLPPDHFDAQAVDWVARTEPTLCCLCFGIGDPAGGVYDIPLDFVSYVCPTFLRIDAPHHLRRPFCSKCSWAVADRVKREERPTVSRPQKQHLWNSTLAHLMTREGFRARVRDNAENLKLLRFDPRRVPERQAA